MPAGHEAATDLLVIGAGPVGLLLAKQVAASRPDLSVRLLEAGTRPPTPPVSATTATGTMHFGGERGRASGLGGTTQMWVGQLWPREAWEFDPRPALGDSGWPLGAAEVQDEYPLVLEELQAASGHQEVHAGKLKSPLPPSDLFQPRYSTWLNWRTRNVGRTLGRDLAHLANVDVRLGVGIKRLDQMAGKGVRALAFDNQQHVARAVVLAAGTFGNFALVQSLDPPPASAGSGFMDHVSARWSSWKVVDPDAFNYYFAPRYVGGTRATQRLVVDRRMAAAEGLLSCFAHFEVELSDEDPQRALRGALQSFQGRPTVSSSLNVARRAAWAAPGFAGVAATSLRTRRRAVSKGSTVHLRIDVEQLPEEARALRMTPNDGVAVDWYIAEGERRTALRFATALHASLDWQALGLRMQREFEAPVFNDTYHMMGGTTMGNNPATSVVDRHCALHGSRGRIHVAGASTFPNGGVANPTMTALALAARLARRLADTL